MSGNPFRASLVVQNHPAAAPPTTFLTADSSNDRADEREHGSGICSTMLSSSFNVKEQAIMIAQCSMSCPSLLPRQRNPSA